MLGYMFNITRNKYMSNKIKILPLFLLFLVTACNSPEESQATTDAVSQETIINTQETVLPETIQSSETVVDVDLTQVHFNLVYSVVTNMMQNPDDYEGKIVRITGRYNCQIIDGQEYMACIVTDGPGCCQTGLEFVPVNRDRLPASDEQITVVGRFTPYVEGENIYFTLLEATIE